MARLQRDLADIRAEYRQLRTPGVPPVVPTPRQAAFMTTKVPRFAGTTSWEQYRLVFDAIVCFERGPASSDAPSNIENGSGGCVVSVAGQIWRIIGDSSKKRLDRQGGSTICDSLGDIGR